MPQHRVVFVGEKDTGLRNPARLARAPAPGGLLGLRVDKGELMDVRPKLQPPLIVQIFFSMDTGRVV